MLGHGPPAAPGELIPETYLDVTGEKRPVDFERLIELGAAEKISAAEAKKTPAVGESEPEPDSDTE